MHKASTPTLALQSTAAKSAARMCMVTLNFKDHRTTSTSRIENELTDSLPLSEAAERPEAAEGDVGARRARHTGQPAGNGLISTAGDDAALAGGRGHVGVWASPTLGARQPPAFGEEKGRHRPQHGGALLACAHDCKPA